MRRGTQDVGSCPFVSVVVAFFNIEECVRYCCESLVSQTYGSYELILVDDGSSDGTGSLLDAYANEPFARVFHTPNGGLSAARNFGVSVARGKYVTFVDGDDIVSSRYLEVLVGALPSTDARVLVNAPFRLLSFDDALSGETASWQARCESAPSARVLQKQDAAREVMYETIQTSAWGKLAPKDVYVRNPFPAGVYYEEISTVCEFVAAVDLVVAVDVPVYGYVMRKDSIVHRKRSSLKQVKDYLRAVERISCGFEALGGGSDDAALAYHTCLEYARIHRLASVAEDDVSEVKRIDRGVVRGIRSRVLGVLADSRAPLANRARFAFLAAAPSLYAMVFRLYERAFKGV